MFHNEIMNLTKVKRVNFDVMFLKINQVKGVVDCDFTFLTLVSV